jgi:hypothetical protein
MNKCTYCGDPSVFQAHDAKGKLVKFCEDCLLVLVTEAIKIFGDRVRDLLT